jgi:formylglycine-generating enzyme required for sulfatase activity
VDHEYQISRTEVTGAEWFEFVQAYAPYVQEDAWSDPAFTSRQVGLVGYRQYFLPPAFANIPVEIGWHFAARFCNWLMNGKAITPDAFESGAYDTSTFHQNSTGGWDNQVTRSPGATYWIPSEDEWIKAAHFDPNRYGPDQPGYWLASNSSDTPPVRGPPGSGGGQTSAAGRNAGYPLPDVASYPGTQTPWGLFDTSGGFGEWTEGAQYSQFADGLVQRRVHGSGWRDDLITINQARLEYIEGRIPKSPLSLVGLRLARAVPGAGCTGVLYVCAVPLLTGRRRLHHDTAPPAHPRLRRLDDPGC